MKKIVLIGVPESGKTELAKRVQKSLQETGQTCSIVDGYIDEIQDRSDNVLDYFASYVGNMQAAIGRWEYERRIERDEKPDVLITCGSLAETAVYEALNGVRYANLEAEQSDLRAAEKHRTTMCMAMLGILRVDTFDYDLAFRLPTVSEEDTWPWVLDTYLDDSMHALAIHPTHLPLGRDEQVDVIVEAWEALKNAAATPAE